MIVFPSGDNDAMRPTSQQAVIDFSGRTGYVSTAIEAGVLIVPVGPDHQEQKLLRIRRGEHGFATEELATVRFVPLVAGVSGRLRGADLT